MTNPDTHSAERSPCSASGALFSPTALPFHSASGGLSQHLDIVPAAFLALHLLPGLPSCCQVRNLPVLDLPSQQGLHFPSYHLEVQNDVERGVQDLWVSAHSLDLAFAEEDYLPAGH